MHIILSGHAQFASGLHSSLTMIAGQSRKVHSVNFDEDLALIDYQAKLEEVVRTVSLQDEPILILTDLRGGTPFQEAVRLKQSMPYLEVIANVNLALLLNLSSHLEDIETSRHLRAWLEDEDVQLYRYQKEVKHISLESEGI